MKLDPDIVAQLDALVLIGGTDLVEFIYEALEALEELHSNQNGCPLYKYETSWNAAMEKTCKVLGYDKHVRQTA